MFFYCSFLAVCLLMAACQPQSQMDHSDPSHTHPKTSNPALTPMEKPALEEDFYEAPPNLP